ncbi:uncharacterized protein ARMOST_20216 [Armillaria ostoyae]|uniref:DUF6532 domain-containing protein n=1 Tax=Armillaria ostoyae TaxID=47428 RepID=A0A284S6P4_ARMOS|nr:uncharacterized protein ARMOST_20216 [Armillaria ostoyae]
MYSANFADQEPDTPQGRGQRESVTTERMVVYNKQRTKTHAAAQRRAQTQATHQLQPGNMPMFTPVHSPAPTGPFPVSYMPSTPIPHGAGACLGQGMQGAQGFVTSTPLAVRSLQAQSSPHLGVDPEQIQPGFTPFQFVQSGALGTLDPALLAELQELANDPSTADWDGDEDGNLATARVPLVGGQLTHCTHLIAPTDPRSVMQDKENQNPMANKCLADELEEMGTSDEEDAHDKKPKRTKKNAGLQLSMLTTGRCELTEGSFPIFLQLVLHANPWMPKANAKLAAVQAFGLRQEYMIAHCDYQGRAEATEYEVDLIIQREVQHRGEIKTLARGWVCSSSNGLFRFRSPLKDEDKEFNRNLVAKLKENSAFVSKNPFDTTLPKSLFRSPMIQGIINDQYFGNGSRSLGLREGFFPNNEVPLTVIALVIVVIECAIDEWRSGMHSKIKFEADVYRHQYDSHLGVLQDWERFTKKSGSLATQKLQQDLFMTGRGHAGVSEEEDDITASASAIVFMDS